MPQLLSVALSHIQLQGKRYRKSLTPLQMNLLFICDQYMY